MRREKEVGELLLREATELGVIGACIERRRRHPCLIGTLDGRSILVPWSGTTRDTHSFEIARQNLRRQVWRNRGML
jgi:hypothetical protein